jgi:TP901 family phage tail tape measure protein
MRLDRLFYTIDAETKGFDEGILKSGEKLRTFVEYAKGNPLVVLGALGAAAAVAAYKVEQMGAAFAHEMAKVQTVARGTKQELDNLGRGVLGVFTSLPVERVEDLTHGLYDIISAGIDASKSIEFLGIAAQAAVGGVTDVSTAVDGLTSVVNAYRQQQLGVKQASDEMFAAVRLGKTTFGELSQHMGQTVAIAAGANVAFADVAAVRRAAHGERLQDGRRDGRREKRDRQHHQTVAAIPRAVW